MTIQQRFRAGLVASVLTAFSAPAFGLYENAAWTSLDNGMQVLVIENHRAPVVHARLVVNVGSDDERPDEAGLAHFVEHMLFRGSDQLGPGEFDLAMASIGADYNASTSTDLTTYYASFGSNHLERWISLEADRMTALAAIPEEVEAERGVVLSEMLQQFDANPRRLFGQDVARLLQGDFHSRPVIGQREVLETATPAQLVEFYDDWYLPNNMTLVVSGDTTLDEVLSLAQQYFGDLQSGELPSKTDQVGIFNSDGALFEVVDERVTQDSASIYTWLPSLTEQGLAESRGKRLQYAAFVFREMVGGDLKAPLDQLLLAGTDPIATAASFGIGFGDYTASASARITPAPGVAVEDALEALRAAVPVAIDQALTEDNLAQAKRRFIRSAIYSNDSIQGPAVSFANAIAVDEPFETTQQFEELVSAVTMEDVWAVIDIYRSSDKKFDAILRGTPAVADDQEQASE